MTRRAACPACGERSEVPSCPSCGAEFLVLGTEGIRPVILQDQRTSEQDQTASDHDQTWADHDQTASDRDQRSADEDQDAADVVLSQGGDVVSHHRSAQARERSSRDRASVSALRDDSGSARTENAEVRDRGAELRERVAGELVRSDDVLTRARQDRVRAAADRARAAEDRLRAARDREQAAHERAEAQRERTESAKNLKASTEDELTGAWSRKFGLEEVARELERAYRTGSKLVLGFVDVNDLKIVNDSQGHLAGDALLRLVGETLLASVRSYDVVVRYGGDEFVCALPNLSIDQARARFETVARILKEANPEHSITFGLAEAEPSDTLRDLIARADAALLSAKR